ncbi:MAG: Histidine kinase [Frankiales bacterium]|nr:Histidine kinase [Frankiales bacterium]
MHDESGPRAWVSVSVGRAVAVFLVAGLLAMVGVGVLLGLAQRRAAVAEAVRDARTLTNLEAHDVVGPALSSEALRPGPARDALDRVVRERVLGDLIVRVKVWDETGLVVYSDDASLVGQRFPLPEDELVALRTGRTAAELSDLDEQENRGERRFGRLLQVYLGVQTPSGQRLLFETYQPYASIREASHRLFLSELPVLVGGLVLLYLLQAPLAYRMAVRLRSAQQQREEHLVAALAAADRERTRIASDLHDGVVQDMAGASWQLSASAERVRATGDVAAADAVDRTARDLRRWVRELRSLIVTVTPPALHDLGLGPALTDLVAVLEGRGTRVELDVDGVPPLEEADEVLAFRVAQEAVRNVVRHAAAARVQVSAGVRDGALVLAVADDGRGFDRAALPRGRGSVGLELLTAVVAAQGGSVDVASAPGAGTTLTLRLPVRVPVTP